MAGIIADVIKVSSVGLIKRSLFYVGLTNGVL